MNWLIVNFYKNEAYTFNVFETKQKKRRNYMLLLLKLLSIFSYVPTGISLATHLLRDKDEYAQL